ncbi:family 20 glycosylhydrolase [Cryobacterium aureum]|uniref:family 20 glycosylhydrolase n=1 Tax=Cryobacterium aureum TaxID=995037 RepID=UPI000CF40638|nr:family 20 glycosylhydrolase [Cryobacterium aureum]
MSLTFSLFPHPRSIEETPGSGPGTGAALRAEVDLTLPTDGFRLQTSPAGILLQHADAAGLRYAQQALDQLRAYRDFATVGVVVEDWPDFAVRGFMLDISRDRVPTRRTLLRLIELLDLARINQLELYTEHTFAYAEHGSVWAEASALTIDDVRWIDDQCARRGIALVPNQNTLGHMERWLKHAPYAHRAENIEGFERMGGHRASSTLAPTAENADFVNELLTELLPLFRSQRVNVGADEPWELGLGVSAAEVSERGRGPVYFDYVSRVLRHWTEQGYEVEFWADVFGNHPELMGQVPAGAIPVVWQYDSAELTRAVVERATDAQRELWAGSDLDVTELQSGFRGRAIVLTEAEENFWVAPGTSAWQSFTGRIDNGVANMIDAAEIGLEFHATGYINTSWGDNGSYDPPAISFAPLLFGGAVSWNLAGNRDLDLADVLNRHVVLDQSGITGRVLVDIGRATHALDAPLLNASQLFTVLHQGGRLAADSWPGAAGIERADAILAQGLNDLDGANPAALDGDSIVRETRLAIRFARFGADILRLRPGGIDTVPAAEARVLLHRFDALIEEHRQTWLLRARPGGLADSVDRLGRMRLALVARAVC